MPLMNIVGTI